MNKKKSEKLKKHELSEYFKAEQGEKFLVAIQKKDKEIKIYDIKEMSSEDCQYIINQLESHLKSLGKVLFDTVSKT